MPINGMQVSFTNGSNKMAYGFSSAMTSHGYLISKMPVVVVGLCIGSDWRD